MLIRGILIALLPIFLSADTLKVTVEKDSFLSEGHVGFIEHNQKIYLVSVGISPITDNSVRANINAIKAAKAIAQSNLVKFIHQVKITSKQELIEVTITTRNEGKISRRHNEKLIETIREESDGILRNVIEIGKWKRDGEYCFALGVESI